MLTVGLAAGSAAATLLPTADAGEEDRDDAVEEEAEGELALEEVVDEVHALLLLLLAI